MMSPDPHQLVILSDLRKQAHVSAQQMASACGLSGSAGRESVRAWERGDAIPQRSRRIHFLAYLLDTLKLRDQQNQLLAIWDILVMQWAWEPLSKQELSAISHPDRRPSGSARPAGLLPPGSWMPYRRLPTFVGREYEMCILTDLYATGTGRAAVLTGMGGIGKTQLAIEYIYRSTASFPGGVFWLNAESPESLPTAIASCGTLMGLHPTFESLPLARQIALVQAALSQHDPRLVVFDNCDDPDVIQHWFPRSGGTRLLITSRRSHWNACLHLHMLPLTMLGRAESLQLLHRHCPDVALDAPDSVAIAAELEDFPLALHLAGRTLARQRDMLTPGSYLAQLRTSTLLWHDQASDDPLAQEQLQSLQRTFAMSIARLNVDNSQDAIAWSLLTRITRLAPGALVLSELLIALLPDCSASQIQDARYQLIDLGLIEQADDQGSIRVHRLVAAYVRRIDASSVDEATHMGVEQAILALVQPYNATEQVTSIRPFETHLRAVTQAALLRHSVQAAALCTALGIYLFNSDVYTEAIAYLEQALSLLPEDSQDGQLQRATILLEFGWAYDSIGQSQTALAYYQRSLTLRQTLLGAQAPETAESWNYVGTALHALGHFAQADHAYTQALQIREAYLGADHRDTAQSINNLGILRLFRGQYPAAYHLLERAVALRERTSEMNYSKRAVALNNMGYLLRKLARYDEALVYLQRALDIRQELFGDLNSYLAHSLNHLGRLAHARGVLAQAEVYLERALAIKRETIPESGWMSNGLSNMGMLRFDQGRLSEAATFLEEALTLNLRLWGVDHWHTARTLNHLGILAAAITDDHSARQHFEQALAIRRCILGEQHPDTANTLGHLAMLDLKQGATARAFERITSALQSHRASLGETHPYTARSLMRLGQVYAAKGQLNEALAIGQQALTHYRTVLGDEHPYTLACENVYKLLGGSGYKEGNKIH